VKKYMQEEEMRSKHQVTETVSDLFAFF